MKSKPMFSRLDKYLFRELFYASLISFVVALVVLLSMQALRLIGVIVSQDVDFIMISKMVGGLALSFVTLVIPISFIFAQLNVFGRMSSDREFVAMQSMGHSPLRLLVPCAALGTIVSLLSLVAALWISPYGNTMFEITANEAYKKKVATVLRSGTFTEDFLGAVLFVEDVNATTNALSRVFMYDENSLGPKSSISAKFGQWNLNDKTSIATLTLKNGVILSDIPEKNVVRLIKFQEYKTNADFSHGEGRARKAPQNLSIDKLLLKINESKISTSKRNYRDLKLYWSELARRYAISFICICFIPLCFGISINNKRTSKNRATLTGIIIIILYWTMYLSGTTWYLKSKVKFFNHSELYAWLILWIPNIIAIALGIFFMHKRSKILK